MKGVSYFYVPRVFDSFFDQMSEPFVTFLVISGYLAIISEVLLAL